MSVIKVLIIVKDLPKALSVHKKNYFRSKIKKIKRASKPGINSNL